MTTIRQLESSSLSFDRGAGRMNENVGAGFALRVLLVVSFAGVLYPPPALPPRELRRRGGSNHGHLPAHFWPARVCPRVSPGFPFPARGPPTADGRPPPPAPAGRTPGSPPAGVIGRAECRCQARGAER